MRGEYYQLVNDMTREKGGGGMGVGEGSKEREGNERGEKKEWKVGEMRRENGKRDGEREGKG